MGASHGPVFSQCGVETWGLQHVETENGLYTEEEVKAVKSLK